MPLVIRMPDGAIRSAAAQHSQSLEALFLHVPGLKVVTPSNPADAKGLLKAAIRSPDPALYLEHKALYTVKGEVPSDVVVPLGTATVAREGQDVTLISYSLTLRKALQSAEQLAEQGVSAEVVDLRSLNPLDWDTVFASVRKTKRAVVAHEAWRAYGVGAEIATRLPFPNALGARGRRGPGNAGRSPGRFGSQGGNDSEKR